MFFEGVGNRSSFSVRDEREDVSAGEIYDQMRTQTTAFLIGFVHEGTLRDMKKYEKLRVCSCASWTFVIPLVSVHEGHEGTRINVSRSKNFRVGAGRKKKPGFFRWRKASHMGRKAGFLPVPVFSPQKNHN